ncbi:ran-specific GTPase-activating protein-like isoform X2 [Lytechinus variegatus]|uniref:ran-specific GTPase-activating protein-like isoform X2 n=1 Tax=Lytechinus variegatus TaxID=7654 RepID=UPI001BB24990|nr:ran-specific GTPase-activating protein-like isoform X2 [Lytechinus variegatus]
MADQEETTSPDIYVEPIVKLEPVDVKSMEEDEEELVKLRARLYRYANEESPAEWKERGTGEIKLLKKKDDPDGHVRVLMRRDKTFKICANHYIQSHMVLKPNCGSDKAFVWNTLADFADEEPKQETLAIRFGNAENAKKFKEKFEECQKVLKEAAAEEKSDEKPENESKQAEKSEKDADDVAEKLGGMTVKDAEKTTDGEAPSKETVKADEETKGEESKKETTKEDEGGSGDSKDAS